MPDLDLDEYILKTYWPSSVLNASNFTSLIARYLCPVITNKLRKSPKIFDVPSAVSDPTFLYCGKPSSLISATKSLN